ncbi:cyclic nucleotide-binding domain-containing protein [Algoriphagus sp.]|uniref:cyclic nucleotide-binding domain-containing protein n=1 Tax=Algoriphagus sp. TaxID=1872435 RepID=UPI0025D87CAE|nr:cyclic nucleotide-binding domain-containing protein [Algoriphagus sp.]
MKEILNVNSKGSNGRQILADLYELRLDQSPATLRQILQFVPFLDGLSSERLDELSVSCKWIEFNPGEEVVREGDEGDCLYIVIKGRLSVYKIINDENKLLGELRRNQLFGESALIDKKPRNATVIAEDRTLLLTLSNESFHSFLIAHPELRNDILGIDAKRKEWANRQKYRPPMESLLKDLAKITEVEDFEVLRELESEVDWVTISKGQMLMKTGEIGEHLFFVLNGTFDIYRVRDDNSSIRLGRVSSGEILGEIALMTNAPRSADVIALEDSELLKLSKSGYEVLISRYPEALKVFSRILADRLVGQLHARSNAAMISSMPVPTDQECKDIVNNPDMILRNLQITQMYHRLTVQLAAILGQHDANWCTFATHASKTAGNSIRREELPGYSLLLWLEDNISFLAGLCKTTDNIIRTMSERSGIVARMDKVIDHVSRCIAAGNLKVFAELAPLFAAFLRTFQDAQNSDPKAVEELCAHLDPGTSANGGQQLISEAFRHYVDAIFETDHKRKSELLLCGNIKIGLHEQTRLQPYIVEALNTPMADILDPKRKYFGNRLVESDPGEDSGIRLRIMSWIIRKWRRVLTRYMMRLRLPYGDLSLGRDLPRLHNRRSYPDVLHNIESEELKNLLSKFDRCNPKTLRNSRSRDWGNLEDRMNFIANLFRSRHKSLELFDQPFFYEQRQAMQESIVPKGRL